jgi:predicted dehydrogenase
MSRPPYRVAILGAGIGAQHVEAFARMPALFRVAILCDADAGRANRLADQLEARGLDRPAHVADYRDAAVYASSIDVVDICLPPWMHADAMRRAIAAGRHVICEKPLVGSLDETDELAAAASAAGVVLMPIFQYRFGRGLARAKHLMASGAAGKVFLASIETHWKRGADYYAVPWRGRRETELGGVMAGHAIHAHDMMTHLLGPVRAVSAMTAVRVNDIETEDCAGALFEMADGSIVVSSATLGSADEHSRLRISCANVTMTSSLAPYAPDREPWSFVPRDPAGAAALEAALSGAPSGSEGYAAQFEGLHAALSGTGAPPVALAEARASIELITAMYHSARTGSRVALPLGKDHPGYRDWHGRSR